MQHFMMKQCTKQQRCSLSPKACAAQTCHRTIPCHTIPYHASVDAAVWHKLCGVCLLKGLDYAVPFCQIY